MSFWRQLTRGLRVLANRNAADQDVSDEVEHYLEQATAAHLAGGLTREEARRMAQLELGNTAVVREQVRSSGWENFVANFFADLRYATRRLRRSPGFTAVAALTLAVGIGGTTAIFSAVNPILFEPLPYPHANRIVLMSDVGTDGSSIDVTFGTYRELAARSRSFDALAGSDVWQPALSGDAEAERLDGQRVSFDYFRVLGISPQAGRDFEESDNQFHGPKVAILSDGLMRRRFGGDSAIVGRQITLDGDPYTVIGVMPRGFENSLLPSAEIWAPMQYRWPAPFQGAEWGHHVSLLARLKPGIAAEQAAHEVAAIGHTPVVEFPRPSWAGLSQGLTVHVLQDDLTRGVRPALMAVLGAVVLVLIIACVNVTNLLLAGGAQRRGEFAIRTALGAGPSRLIRQVLTESLLLALVGGVLGMFLAQLGVGALIALSPPELSVAARTSISPQPGPWPNYAIALNGTAFAFALLVTTLVGLAVGLVPALQASHGDPHQGLRQSSRGAVTTGNYLTRRALVVAEVGLALVLLVSAGLLLRSLQRLFAVAPGFEAAHLLTMQVEAAGHAYDPDDARYRFFDQALQAVRAVPGVTSAAFTSQLPLSDDFEKYGYELASVPPSADPNEDESAFRYAVTPDYLQTLGIPLRTGRLLDTHDIAGAPEAILISESLAKRKFPGQDPVGQRIHFGPEMGATPPHWDVIVGVVGDVKQASLALSQPNAFYVAMGQWPWVDRVQTLVVRTSGDAAALAPSVRNAIWSVDKNQPVVRVATMDSLIAKSAAERRFALIIFEAFGLVALILAATGIYGVLSGSVAERIREIGVRAALGASPRSILALVLRQGMALTILGVLIGLAGATIATQAIVTLLFGVSRLDPATYFGVVALLLAISALACWLPAQRAARVDPATTLRAE
jgi:putative ABC transport system permease protein